LLAVAHHAEGGVHHAAVRVDAERGGEEEIARPRVAVEEVAVVEVAIAGAGVGDRLGILGDRVVVIARQHGQAFEDSSSKDGFSTATSRMACAARCWPSAARTGAAWSSGRRASISYARVTIARNAAARATGGPSGASATARVSSLRYGGGSTSAPCSSAPPTPAAPASASSAF